ARNSALSLAGDLGSKAGLMVVMIVAAHALSVRDVAAVGTALAVSGIVAYLLDGGAALLITRNGARGSQQRSGLFLVLARVRLPLAVVMVCAGVAVGAATGRLAVWLCASLLGLAGAAGMPLI